MATNLMAAVAAYRKALANIEPCKEAIRVEQEKNARSTWPENRDAWIKAQDALKAAQATLNEIAVPALIAAAIEPYQRFTQSQLVRMAEEEEVRLAGSFSEKDVRPKLIILVRKVVENQRVADLSKEQVDDICNYINTIRFRGPEWFLPYRSDVREWLLNEGYYALVDVLDLMY